MKLFGVGDGKQNLRGPEVVDEVSPERRDEILDYVAKKIADYGLITLAIIVLEGYRPVSYIASQALQFAAPFGDVLMGSPYASELGFVMQDRDNITRLVERLEALARKEDNELRQAKQAAAKSNMPPDEPKE